MLVAFLRIVFRLLRWMRVGLLIRKRGLVFISYPDVSDSSLAMYLHLLHRGEEADLIWLAEDVRKASARLSTMSDAVHCVVIRKNSVRGLLSVLCARVVFYTHGHYSFMPTGWSGTRFVNLWHGMPLKAIGLLDGKRRTELPYMDSVIASSDYFANIMADAFGLRRSQVWVTGLPRCDRFTAPSSDVRKLQRSLVASATTGKMIVWMPTYMLSIKGDIRNDGGGSRSQYLATFAAACRTLSEMCSAEGVVCVAKIHPMDFLNECELAEYPGLVVVKASDERFSALDFYEFLALTDGLISDVSSVILDYMLLGRPIALKRAPDYGRALTAAMSHHLESCFYFDDVGELAPFLKDVCEEQHYVYPSSLTGDLGGACDRVLVRCGV